MDCAYSIDGYKSTSADHPAKTLYTAITAHFHADTAVIACRPCPSTGQGGDLARTCIVCEWEQHPDLAVAADQAPCAQFLCCPFTGLKSSILSRTKLSFVLIQSRLVLNFTLAVIGHVYRGRGRRTRIPPLCLSAASVADARNPDTPTYASRHSSISATSRPSWAVQDYGPLRHIHPAPAHQVYGLFQSQTTALMNIRSPTRLTESHRGAEGSSIDSVPL
ncbi:hypothetical protein BD626DRAFT_174644 [Schizophyllum amplum]|uniref:Uncharacterized protein n=1 Tax=Schizophyllum amplum TaxID=97359 RepID=A0A550C2K2_9AGAR|nr:hypothetical protein BD626DRAFT_174644 [Auriculariopsis ampla]